MLQPHKPDMLLCFLAFEVSRTISCINDYFLWRSIFPVLVLKVQVGIHLESISSYSKQCQWHMEYIGPWCYSTIYCFWNVFFIVFIILYTDVFLFIFYSVCRCLQNDPWKNHFSFFFFTFSWSVSKFTLKIITWSVWIILHNHVTGQSVWGIESVQFCTFLSST